MADISKKDIKDVVVEVLEPFAQAIQDDFKEVNKSLGKMDLRLTSVEGRLSAVEKDVSWMKENFSELFTRLDKFITMYEDQKQELRVLVNQVRRLEERITVLEVRKT